MERREGGRKEKEGRERRRKGWRQEKSDLKARFLVSPS